MKVFFLIFQDPVPIISMEISSKRVSCIGVSVCAFYVSDKVKR